MLNDGKIAGKGRHEELMSSCPVYVDIVNSQMKGGNWMDELELYENNGFETAQHAGKTIRRFIRSLGKQRTRLMIVLLSVAIYSTLNIFAPLYSAIVVDVIWNRIQELRGLEKAFHITWEYGGRQIMAMLSLYLAAGVFYILQISLWQVSRKN